MKSKSQFRPHGVVQANRAPAPASVSRESQLTAMAAQINAVETADPALLATAIERYLLLDIFEILSNPGAPPEIRAAATNAYFKWRNGDLARQRLALQAAKFAARNEPAEPPKPAESSAPPPAADREVTPEESRLILDKFDEIFGLKSPAQINSPPPADSFASSADDSKPIPIPIPSTP